MTPALHIDQLSKRFTIRERPPGRLGWLRGLFHSPARDVIAVDRISLSIAPGERVAFVGPNGAGKSTTIKMCAGILWPSDGEVRVAGLVPWRERKQLAHRIGTVFGQRSQLWQHLPAGDTFDLLAAIYDVPRDEYRARRRALVEAFEIGDELARPVRQLSLGQRMRCEIVASLLHAPDVLFLDEPTIGLDVCARATIRDLVRAQAERDGRTVLLTSHDTGDMERVCERVVVIHGGRILLDQTIDALRRGFIRRKRVTLHTADPRPELAMPGVRELGRAAHRLELEVDLDIVPVDAVVQAALRSARLVDLTVEDPGMDEVVQAIYARADEGRAVS
jgi:viologen exporter family transport system ATP-binding protein